MASHNKYSKMEISEIDVNDESMEIIVEEEQKEQRDIDVPMPSNNISTCVTTEDCLFSDTSQWNAKAPLPYDPPALCHLCHSIVTITFNPLPNIDQIKTMRHICIRVHKHMDTFSFNTASSCNTRRCQPPNELRALR